MDPQQSADGRQGAASPPGGMSAPQDERQAEQATQVVPRDDEPQQLGPEIEEPARLLRIAMAVQTLFQEVKTTELDEAARQRLTDIHNRTIEDLRDLVSSDLEAELDAFTLEQHGSPPSGAELRVMQAQLAGWLQGLFHGIQASIATQQMAAQQQLARMREQSPGQLPGGKPGQYL